MLKRVRAKRPSSGTVLGLVALIAATSGIAAAGLPTSDGTIVACISLQTGVYNDSSATGECPRGYRKVTLSTSVRVGPTGPPGPTGPIGPTGSGPTGPTGPPGPGLGGAIGGTIDASTSAEPNYGPALDLGFMTVALACRQGGANGISDADFLQAATGGGGMVVFSPLEEFAPRDVFGSGPAGFFTPGNHFMTVQVRAQDDASRIATIWASEDFHDGVCDYTIQGISTG